MGKIHDVQKLTDNRFVNLYHVDATSVHNTPVSYYVASRAKDIPSLKLRTGRNDPDGVIIYSIYGEKKDRVVLIRQYRYALGGYIYEFPAGLVEPNEDFHEGAVREMHEETGLKLEPLKVDPKIKFARSPTPAVMVPFVTRCTRILTSSITAPATGPIAKAPTSTGISEKSS